MVVRVRAVVEAKGRGRARRVRTIAVANTGYETINPEVMIPLPIAERLGLWPDVPRGARAEEYMTAGGITRVYKVKSAVRLRVEAQGRSSKAVECDAAISEHEDEVLLGDRLVSALGIVIEDAGGGFWRFRDDRRGTLRESLKPELW